MALQVWNNCKLYFDAYNLSGDMNALAFDYGVESKDATVLTDAARRRKGGLKTLTFQHEGFWNGGVGNVDDALFSEIALADKPMTIAPLTGAEGEVAYFFNALAAQYQPGASVGEMFKFSVSGEASDGRDLIRGTIVLNGTQTASGNGSIFQLGAVGSAQKLYAVLHVFDPVAGTTPTLAVKVQSAAAAGFTTPTDRIVFAQKIAKGSEYATPVAGAITDAYWRVAWTITGTGPSFPFIVAVGIQ